LPLQNKTTGLIHPMEQTVKSKQVAKLRQAIDRIQILPKK
jgi:hypothetical protein